MILTLTTLVTRFHGEFEAGLSNMRVCLKISQLVKIIIGNRCAIVLP